ncbi:MAG TPA: ParB/RepB/Spo0J family partition protein [Candidatus Saccharimonadales bacterium]|nr:ParB/RepB/Spo0J family partition protein [Candidatus Saccharimonadales bacterium]
MDTKKLINYGLQDLSIDVVEYDDNQPRKDISAKAAISNLKRSIEHYGIQQPITVTEYERGKYKIIDGHRRYICANELELKVVPCLVYPELSPGEMEARRYEMQNIRRPWKPLERSDALHRMKREFGFQSIKELAQYIGISEASAADYLHLREQQLHLLSRLAERGLNDTYQIEIVRLKPHLRKVGGMQVDQIIDDILDRISNGTIKSSKDIRIIKSAFIRFDLYGDILATYLKNPEMRVQELEEQILRNGFSWDIQKAVATIAKKKSKGERMTDKEVNALEQLVQISQEMIEAERAVI